MFEVCLKIISIFVIFIAINLLTPPNSLASEGEATTKLYDIDITDLLEIDIEKLRGNDVVIKVYFFDEDARLNAQKVSILKKSTNSLNLEVYGICAGECSLFLLPNVDKVTIHKDANIFLTSSMIDVSVMEMSNSLFGNSYSTDTLSLKSFKSSKSSYETKMDNAAKFMREISKMGKSPHHLLMHSMFTRGLRRRFSENCTFGFTFGISLDPEYLQNEFYKVIGKTNTKLILTEDYMSAIEKYKSTLVIVEPYTFIINIDEDLDRFDRKFCFVEGG